MLKKTEEWVVTRTTTRNGLKKVDSEDRYPTLSVAHHAVLDLLKRLGVGDTDYNTDSKYHKITIHRREITDWDSLISLGPDEDGRIVVKQ